jgi:hypothetical protein
MVTDLSIRVVTDLSVPMVTVLSFRMVTGLSFRMVTDLAPAWLPFLAFIWSPQLNSASSYLHSVCTPPSTKVRMITCSPPDGHSRRLSTRLSVSVLPSITAERSYVSYVSMGSLAERSLSMYSSTARPS